jgi:hypothetical protein
MIPVVKQREPEDFNEKVRIPGRSFLKKNPHPNSEQFQSHNFWRHIKGDLYRRYKNICAYTGEWFPETSASIDHFIPKSKDPEQAYEWDNYRLTTGKINNSKGDALGLIDPFEVQIGWFVMIFPACFIKSCNNLNEAFRKKVDHTINILRLNSNERVEKRCGIISNYISKNISIGFLRKNYPYIACELERQGLREKIANFFKPLPGEPRKV